MRYLEVAPKLQIWWKLFRVIANLQKQNAVIFCTYTIASSLLPICATFPRQSNLLDGQKPSSTVQVDLVWHVWQCYGHTQRCHMALGHSSHPTNRHNSHSWWEWGESLIRREYKQISNRSWQDFSDETESDEDVWQWRVTLLIWLMKHGIGTGTVRVLWGPRFAHFY